MSLGRSDPRSTVSGRTGAVPIAVAFAVRIDEVDIPDGTQVVDDGDQPSVG